MRRSWFGASPLHLIPCSRLRPQYSRSQVVPFIIAHLPVVPLEQEA